MSVSISRSFRATAAVIRLRRSLRLGGVEAQRQCPTQTPIRNSRTGLNPGTGVATALTRQLLLCVFQNTKWLLSFTERHICYYCLLAANQGNYVHELFFKKTSTFSLCIDVRTTMISGVVYLLRIFKMFHGLMNNPVYMWYRNITNKKLLKC